MFKPADPFEARVLGHLTKKKQSAGEVFHALRSLGISKRDIKLVLDRLVESGQAIKLTVRCGKDTKSYWKLA